MAGKKENPAVLALAAEQRFIRQKQDMKEIHFKKGDADGTFNNERRI